MISKTSSRQPSTLPLSPSLARADRQLLRILDETASEARRLAARPDGTSWLACRSGCGSCCHGPFPINALDVLRLRQGIELLEASDPERAKRIRDRADAQVLSLRRNLPEDPETARLAAMIENDERIAAYLDREGPLPCPVLHPETASCELYAFRPVICRTYGPPVRTIKRDLAPCTLCFQGAAPEVVESCQVEGDLSGVEDWILDRIEPDGEAETLIAFAVSTLK